MTGSGPPPGLRLHDLEQIGTSAEWFRDRLAAEEIRLHGSSSLAVALNRLREFRTGAAEGRTWRFPDARSAYGWFVEAIGADFLTKAIHAGAEAGFTLPKGRWTLLCSGDPILTRPGERSRERDQTWETVLASLAATFAGEVTFAEPDIVCEFSGKRFAIAAKVGYSRDNLLPNIEKGFEQADGKAAASLVFLNAASLYPQVETFDWSKSRRFQSNDEAVEVMNASIGRWCDNELPLASLTRQVRARGTEPIGVAFFFPLLLSFRDHPVPYFYSHMPLTWAGAAGPDYEFTKAFLNACSHILGFRSKGLAA